MVGFYNVMTRVLFLLLISISILMFGCATVAKKEVADNVEAQNSLSIEEKWGIKVMGIRPTADGNMLHFRYRILDAEKANSLVQPMVKPYVIDNASGKRVMVPSLPKVGSLRQRSKEAKSDRIYFILFSNPRKFIKSGNEVTVVIGDFKTEGLTVQ